MKTAAATLTEAIARWRIKYGEEAHRRSFAAEMPHASGYYVPFSRKTHLKAVDMAKIVWYPVRVNVKMGSFLRLLFSESVRLV